MYKNIETIDLTPTWSGILPALLAVIQNGSVEGVKLAEVELRQMARLADLYAISRKEQAK